MSGQINGYSLKEMMGASTIATEQRKQNIMASNPMASNYGDGARIEAATSHLTYNPHYNATANDNFVGRAALTPGQVVGDVAAGPNEVAPQDLEAYIPATKTPKPTRKYDLNLKGLSLGKGGFHNNNMIWYSVAAVALIFVVFYLLSGKNMGSAASSSVNEAVKSVKRSMPKFNL